MVDITKCSGIHCKRRNKCYRFTVPAGEPQSWFARPPLDRKDGHCQYFWPIEGWEASPPTHAHNPEEHVPDDIIEPPVEE